MKPVACRRFTAGRELPRFVDMVGAVPVADWPRIVDERVQIFVEHQNLQWCRAEDADDYRGWCDAYWTDFNGGGWVWNGHMGRVTFVRPRSENAAASTL